MRIITPEQERKQQIRQQQGKMQRNCQNCQYYYNQICNYIYMEGHRRPCPPGDDCTVKKPRKRGRPPKKKEEPTA